MRPVKRYELVELIIPANNTALRIPFQDIPQLRSDVTQDIIIRQLETYSSESMPNDYNNVPLMTNALMLRVFLTFYIQQEESVFRMPAVKLLNIYNAASAAAYFYTDELVQAENWLVDWTKTYLTLASSIGNVVNTAFMLGVGYQRLPGGTIARLQKQMNPANSAQYQGDWYTS